MPALKSIKQLYAPDDHMLNMMNTFRMMINECIRTGLKSNKTSMKSLSIVCYPMLKAYRIDSRYKLCAISKAAGILRNYRKALRKNQNVSIPYCRRSILTTCYGLSIREGFLQIPSKIKIPLNKHTLQILSDKNIMMRSVTITPDSINISILKNAVQMHCEGMLSIDRNLDNVTIVDTDGNVKQYDMRKATEIKAKCRQVKGRFVRNDVRIRKILFKKYGMLQRNRVLWIIHNVSKRIVEHAKQNHMTIAMEDIKGIRKLYRKGNYQGRRYRAKMNSWSYHELQRQLEYKAAWEGIPVVYVSPWGTSSKCSRCGSGDMKPEENRVLRCVSCKLSIDRDINAARNILARGLRFEPVGLPNEAMIVERSKEGKRSKELIHRVDGSQSGHQTKT